MLGTLITKHSLVFSLFICKTRADFFRKNGTYRANLVIIFKAKAFVEQALTDQTLMQVGQNG
jgi:hypothetical protein